MRLRQITQSAFAAAALAMAATGAVRADPVWDRVQSSGKLVCGAIPNDPIGSWVDPQTRQWEGYEIELCRAIAADLSKEMGRTVTPEFRETSWKTIVLDIQSQKLDIWPGMSATEERKKALSMIGPMYGLAFCAVNRKGFAGGKTWDELNKPEVRIATVTGTSTEAAFKKFAPKATNISLSEHSEVALAVQSGRADMMGTDVLRCLHMIKQAPKVFGEVIFPQPVQTMGSSAGLVKDAVRLSSWLENWAKQKQGEGAIRGMFVKVLEKAEFDTSVIPPEVQF